MGFSHSVSSMEAQLVPEWLWCTGIQHRRLEQHWAGHQRRPRKRRAQSPHATVTLSKGSSSQTRLLWRPCQRPMVMQASATSCATPCGLPMASSSLCGEYTCIVQRPLHASPAALAAYQDSHLVLHAEASELVDTMLEFRVADSEECAVCMHEYSQDMSTGQVSLQDAVLAECLWHHHCRNLLYSCGIADQN